MRIYWRTPGAFVLAVALVLLSASLASAHQPFFEDKDFTAKTPGVVKDPTVSTALYATLDSSRDIDYVTFDGKRGQSILVGLTIPAIAGQENFTPTVAIMGPGLPPANTTPSATPSRCPCQVRCRRLASCPRQGQRILRAVQPHELLGAAGKPHRTARRRALHAGSVE